MHGRTAAERAAKELAGAHLFTTDEVLSEFLAAVASGGKHLRRTAVEVVGALLRDPDVTVVAQFRRSFLEGLRLYGERLDKGYSLADCISISAMLRHRIREVLTNDRHFEQEGCVILMDREAKL